MARRPVALYLAIALACVLVGAVQPLRAEPHVLKPERFVSLAGLVSNGDAGTLRVSGNGTATTGGRFVLARNADGTTGEWLVGYLAMQVTVDWYENTRTGLVQARLVLDDAPVIIVDIVRRPNGRTVLESVSLLDGRLQEEVRNGYATFSVANYAVNSVTRAGEHKVAAEVRSSGARMVRAKVVGRRSGLRLTRQSPGRPQVADVHVSKTDAGGSEGALRVVVRVVNTGDAGVPGVTVAIREASERLRIIGPRVRRIGHLEREATVSFGLRPHGGRGEAFAIAIAPDVGAGQAPQTYRLDSSKREKWVQLGLVAGGACVLLLGVCAAVLRWPR